MKVVFQDLSQGSPQSGELWLCSADEDRRDLSEWMFEDGLEEFAQGEGPISRIVVNFHPTLDDMLAASFAQILLDQGQLKPWHGDLAKYARLARKGLSPSRVEPEMTIEAIFTALTKKETDKPDFTQSSEARSFLRDWKRMFRRMETELEAGADPFVEPLFERGADFAEERAFLLQDREVYRQDVARGESLVVTLPGGPANSSALLLREPKSLLFRDWSRRDRQAPTGDLYLFLGVDWTGSGDWVFSVPPAQRLSLKDLYLQLQEAENEASQTPPQWWDGAAHRHTIIAAPKQGQTALPSGRVVDLVKGWLQARAEVGPVEQCEGATVGDLQALESTVRKLEEERAKVLEGGKVLAQASADRVAEDMGAWVSHNLNNKLQAAYSISKTWMDRQQACPPKHLEHILASLEEAMQKVDSIKGGARSSELHEAVPLAPLIQEACLIAGRALEGIEVECVVGPEVLESASQVQMKVTLVHLLNNAGEAIKARQRLEPELVGKVRCVCHAEDGMLRLEVEDNGCGVPAEGVDFLFSDRPFTSKGEKGTGLGLRIVKSTVDSHGGQLTWQPREGGGTVFRMSGLRLRKP